MTRLLAATAVLEVGAGLAIMCFPSGVAIFLIGAPLTTPAALSVGRVVAAALLALGVACWLARYAKDILMHQMIRLDLSFGSGVHTGLGINEKAVAQRNRVR